MFISVKKRIFLYKMYTKLTTILEFQICTRQSSTAGSFDDSSLSLTKLGIIQSQSIMNKSMNIHRVSTNKFMNHTLFVFSLMMSSIK